MNLENVLINVLWSCGIVLAICFTVCICFFVYLGTKEMFDKYKADKKKLYKRDLRES
ncbi:hypothetical protein H0242_31470 (plasmid) [Bacillus thuringiensis serovar sumiyoshiensis]|uniref:hypothetical protein n=1 Tax=Bacillus thuringiensis TaxID=1428 RepID=UPI00399A7D3E